MAIQSTVIPLDRLLPDERNPKKHNAENIKRLVSRIQAVGFTAPVLVDEKTGILKAGHRRRLALYWLRENNFPEPDGVEPGWGVPARVGSWTELQALQVLVGDNEDPEEIEFDQTDLTALLAELSDLGGLEGAGYNAERLDALIGELSGEPELGSGGGGLLPEADPDEVPEDAPTRCQPGDLWQLGEHRLLIGDCRNAEDVARLLQGEKVNVCVTSPPYASQRKYDEESGFKPIHPDEYVGWFEAVQANIRQVLAEDGSFFLNIKEHCEDGQRHLYVKDLTLAHVREWGWRFVEEYIWTHEGTPINPESGRFKNAWEPIFHFAKEPGHKIRPNAVKHQSDRVPEWVPGRGNKTNLGNFGINGDVAGGMALPSNNLKINKGVGRDDQAKHPAKFPTALPEFFIQAFSDAGDVVLEPFAGSGTTIVAAEKLGRRCRGFDVSPEYGDVCIARWERFTGRTAELLERL